MLFFSLIAWTALDQVSFVFILPLISILILYKDPKFYKGYDVGNYVCIDNK